MSAQLARLGSTGHLPDERRREQRHTARGQVLLQTTRGESASVALVDVSSHGCAVQVEGCALRVGGFVGIGIVPHAELRAIIRWVRDGMAGMEFLAPIPAERAEWHALIN